MQTEQPDSPPQIVMSEPIARCVLVMWANCYSDGLLPDMDEIDELLKWIAVHYPHLKTERDFTHLPWPSSGDK